MTRIPKAYTRVENVKVTMLECAAGPNGVARKNRVVDVPNETAKQWIDGRHARPYEEKLDAGKKVGFERAKETEQ